MPQCTVYVTCYTTHMTLDELGWAQYVARVGSEVEVDPDCVARVVSDLIIICTICTNHGKYKCWGHFAA